MHAFAPQPLNRTSFCFQVLQAAAERQLGRRRGGALLASHTQSQRRQQAKIFVTDDYMYFSVLSNGVRARERVLRR